MYKCDSPPQLNRDDLWDILEMGTETKDYEYLYDVAKHVTELNMIYTLH